MAYKQLSIKNFQLRILQKSPSGEELKIKISEFWVLAGLTKRMFKA
jgi:hypothetical protein